jgi:integrase
MIFGHTCLTLLLDLGTPPHVVQEIVGHSVIEVTMTIYAHAPSPRKARPWASSERRWDDAGAVSVAVNHRIAI